MVVRLKDLMSAEEALDAALERLEEARSPRSWSAHETVDRDGRRQLHVADTDLRMVELRSAEVRAAEERLRNLWRAAGAGVDAHSATAFTLGGE